MNGIIKKLRFQQSYLWCMCGKQFKFKTLNIFFGRGSFEIFILKFMETILLAYLLDIIHKFHTYNF